MQEIMANGNGESVENKLKVQDMTDSILLDVRKEAIPTEKTISMPISQLATLGAGVSSLIPAFNTVTQTTTVNVQGYYQVTNAGIGDALKAAKEGKFWGAIKKADGSSAMAKLAPVDSASQTTQMVMKANPATMMMAVALASIERELGNIAEMEKQILTFLQVEKESEIEADVITLNEIIAKYKHNWDNEHYVASNHKMVCDIQRTARKNMISFQKKVSEAVKGSKLVVKQSQVNSAQKDLQKKFKYYRLSLYTFALASLAEIILSGNFKEENINASIEEVQKYSGEYRELFSECSVFLERMSKKSLETQVIKGVGTASSAVGKLIGGIPKVKDGKADEFLQAKGKKIKQSAIGMKEKAVRAFSEVSNPNTSVFVDKMEEMVRIYNRTTEICFDRENIYLIAEN